MYLYVLFAKKDMFFNVNWCNSLPEIPALQRKEDSPNFLMDASAVVMELGLSMQKAVLFFFSPKIFFCRSKLQGFRDHLN